MNEVSWQTGAEPDLMLDHLYPHDADDADYPPTRKLRLFACACCRRIWDLMPDRVFQRAVEAGERYADGVRWVPLAQECSSAEEQAAWQRYESQRDRLAQECSRAEEQAREALDTLLTNSPLDAELQQLLAEAPPERRQEFHRALLGPEVYQSAAYRAAAAASWVVEEWVWPPPGREFKRLSAELAQFVSDEQAERAAHCDLIRCLFGNPFRQATADAAWLTSAVLGLARGIYEDRAFDRLPILADALEDAGCASLDVLDHCRSGGRHALGCWVLDLLLAKE
jgi:hypothetical protein